MQIANCKMQNAKCKMQIKGTQYLGWTSSDSPICIISAGTNDEEKCASESQLDFLHEIWIVLKGNRQSLYFLKLTKKA
jgi:hypothetical protein